MSEQKTQDKTSRSTSGQPDGDAASGGAATLSRRERLAAAAEQRRTQRAKERAQAASIGLDASERVDDALTRASAKSARFVRNHFNVMQWVFVAVIAGWVGYQIYLYRTAKSQAMVGDTLSEGAVAVLTPLTADEATPPQPGLPEDPGPKFASEAERIKAAREAFNAAISLHKTEGSVAYAELSLAGLLFDEGKFTDARASYERIKGEPTTQKFPELHGRAMEGIALTYEAAGDTDGALKAYRELENSGIDGFVEMALLAEGRLLVDKGETAQATEALDKLNKRLEKEKDGIKAQSTFYIGPTLSALQAVVDPEGKTKAASGAGTDMEALQKTLQELAKKAAAQPAPAPGEPEAPAPGSAEPTPEAPAPEAPKPAPVTAPAAPAPSPKPASPTTPKPVAPVVPVAPAVPAAPAPAPVPAAPTEPNPGSETPPQ